MKRAITVMASLATVALAASCGDSSNADGGGTGADITTIRASVVPSIDSASLYLAEQQGFFADEGLKLEASQAGSGPAAVASVVGGTADVGLAANVALIQAQAKNIPIVAAAGAAGTGSDPAISKDQVLVLEGSPIEGFEDLSSKTVAVVAVKNSPELFNRYMIDEAGGDSATTKFVEIPFPEMSSALQSGRVDAIAVNEPFLTGALAQGARPLGSYIDDVLGPETGYTYWFTSKELAASSADTVASFNKAMKRAGAYADEHPEEVRAIIHDKLGIDTAVAEKINLPRFGNELETDSFGRVAELMLEYGYIESPPDTSAVFADGVG